MDLYYVNAVLHLARPVESRHHPRLLGDDILVKYTSKLIESMSAKSNATTRHGKDSTSNVRIVCLFINGLLRHGLVEVIMGLHVEMESFCLQHAKISEAAQLYSSLQSIWK